MNSFKTPIHNTTIHNNAVFVSEALMPDIKLTETTCRELLKKHRIRREKVQQETERRFKVKDHYVCRNCVQKHNHTHYYYKAMYEITMPCGQMARLCIPHGKNFAPHGDGTKIKLPEIWDENYLVIKR